MPNKKIDKFQPSNLEELREKLVVALEQVSEEYGILFKIGRFSYTSDSFDFKTNVRRVMKLKLKDLEYQLLRGSIWEQGSTNYLLIIMVNLME